MVRENRVQQECRPDTGGRATPTAGVGRASGAADGSWQPDSESGEGAACLHEEQGVGAPLQGQGAQVGREKAAPREGWLDGSRGQGSRVWLSEGQRDGVEDGGGGVVVADDWLQGRVSGLGAGEHGLEPPPLCCLSG